MELLAGSLELALLAGVPAQKMVHRRCGYARGDQLGTQAHHPTGAICLCLCFQGSEAMDLNTFLHEMFSLDRIFTGDFKSLKQGYNWNFESKTTEPLISYKSQ